MIVVDQRESGGQVACLTDPHQRPCGKQLPIAARITGQPGDNRPDDEANENDFGAAEAVSDGD